MTQYLINDSIIEQEWTSNQKSDELLNAFKDLIKIMTLPNQHSKVIPIKFLEYLKMTCVKYPDGK